MTTEGQETTTQVNTENVSGENTTSEQQPEGNAIYKEEETPKGGETPKKEEGEKVEGAPEKYEAFSAPEGITLDKAMVSKFSETAKELNLSQANAQKLLNLASENAQGLMKGQTEAYHKVREGWVNELREDTEFGGTKFDETIEQAKRVLNKFGSDELKGYLAKSGIGDNNEVVKMLARIGKSLGEDKFVDGTPTTTKKSAAEVLYGKT